MNLLAESRCYYPKLLLLLCASAERTSHGQSRYIRLWKASKLLTAHLSTAKYGSENPRTVRLAAFCAIFISLKSLQSLLLIDRV